MRQAIRCCFALCCLAAVAACDSGAQGEAKSVGGATPARTALAFAEAMRRNDYEAIVELDTYAQSEIASAVRRIQSSAPQSLWEEQISAARSETVERDIDRLRRRADGHRFSPWFRFFRTGAVASVEQTGNQVFLEMEYEPSNDPDAWGGAYFYPLYSDRDGSHQVEKIFVSVTVEEGGYVGRLQLVDGSISYKEGPPVAEFNTISWSWRARQGDLTARISAKLMGDASLAEAEISDASCRSQTSGDLYSFSQNGGQIATYGVGSGQFTWSGANAGRALPDSLFPAWCSITATSGGRTATGVINVSGPPQRECWTPRNVLTNINYAMCSDFQGEIYPLEVARANGWFE
jgi:hypothetical protein